MLSKKSEKVFDELLNFWSKIEVLTEVKESIINAYAAKSGLSHARIANLMSNETWMNAKKAVELGFADEILFAKKEEEPDSDPAAPENPEKDPDSEPGEGEEKKPFQKDTAGHLFSSRQMDLIVLNRLGVKPEDVGQKHTEPKEPTADPKPSAEPTPPAEPPANSGPVLDLDGKTEDGSIPYRKKKVRSQPNRRAWCLQFAGAVRPEISHQQVTASASEISSTISNPLTR